MQNLKKSTFVTTSWDDGDRADLKVAALLRDKGISGTFYVPVRYRERPLDHSELRDLASGVFEIGAHGVSHKHLWGLGSRNLAEEVGPCKPFLEDITGKEVRMFCYPAGRYDSSVIKALQQTGYWGARTNRMLATRLTFKPFEMPTTLQIFDHSKFTYLKNVARARSLDRLPTFLTHMRVLGSWLELGKRLFDDVLKKGGMWHLHGHSWEIERLGLWDDLREILSYVGRRDDVCYVPNYALLPPSANGLAKEAQVCTSFEAISKGR